MSGWRYSDDIPERDGVADEQLRATRSQGDAADHAAGSIDRHDDGVKQVGSVIADRYVLRSHLGRGRYGEIYEAVDRKLSDPLIELEHRVALHLLHDRIAQQTRLLRKLEASYHQPHLWSHPNVVKVRGFGSDEGKYYLVVELLEGVTLRAILDDPPSESVSEDEVFAVLRAVGDALKYAHAKGAIHGDIRPEKIFITEGYGVKVLDLLPASAPRASPFFVEDSASGGSADPDRRDDVYGLACLAYELFAGRHPYNANSPLEALEAGLDATPILRLGAERWDALARGLALRREDRTANIATFLAELGITGFEKLRPKGDVPASPPAEVTGPTERTRAEEDVPILGDYSGTWELRNQPAPQAQPPPAPEPRGRAALQHSVAPRQHHPRDFELFAEIPERRERRERRKPRRMLWGVALVAGLAAAAAVGVYWTYPPARTRASEWLATGETLAKTAMSRVTEALSKAERQAPVVAPTAEVAPPPAADVAAESASSTPATARSVVESSAPVEPPKQPEPEPEQNQPATAAAPPAPVRAVEPEIVEFAASVVTVSESTGVATAAIRRRGGTLGESSFAWWTSDGSALADDDYANLGARIEKFAAGEQTRAIYIPLVSDSKAESRETFYVNLREGEQLGRGRDQAEQIEIVVLDDD